MAEDAAATPCIQPLVPAERTTDEILVHFHSLTQTHLIGRSSQAASVIIVKPVHYYFVVQHSTAARHRTLRAAINNAVKQLTMRATSSEDINQAAKRFPGVNCIQQTVQKTQACTSLQATLLIV